MIKIGRLKEKKDLEAIAEEYASYYNSSILKEKWTRESVISMFEYFHNSAPDLFFVAYDNSKPVGVIMACLKPWWDGMHLEDGEVFVCKQYRHKRIAKMLFKKLFEYAMEKYNASTLEAHTYRDEKGFPYCWYKKLGFETINNWKIISGDIKIIIFV